MYEDCLFKRILIFRGMEGSLIIEYYFIKNLINLNLQIFQGDKGVFMKVYGVLYLYKN